MHRTMIFDDRATAKLKKGDCPCCYSASGMYIKVMKGFNQAIQAMQNSSDECIVLTWRCHSRSKIQVFILTDR